MKYRIFELRTKDFSVRVSLHNFSSGVHNLDSLPSFSSHDNPIAWKGPKIFVNNQRMKSKISPSVIRKRVCKTVVFLPGPRKPHTPPRASFFARSRFFARSKNTFVTNQRGKKCFSAAVYLQQSSTSSVTPTTHPRTLLQLVP